MMRYIYINESGESVAIDSLDELPATAQRLFELKKINNLEAYYEIELPNNNS